MPKPLQQQSTLTAVNMVIGTFCTLPEIRNTLDRMKNTANIFIYRRKNLLNEVMASNSHPLEKRKALIDVCRTRWAACHRAYSHFYVAYTWMVKSFEVIAFGAYKDVYNNNVTSGWEAKYKAEANSLLNAITNFEFIVVFLIVYNFLSHLEGITVKLQSSSLDIIEAFNAIDKIKALSTKI
ncbi:hypothetical protein CAPTEDRAFT_211967 [Capitella teleta]|uniref:Uncharacterized protein n=1 Tax=Capitella teleta TaxID=283909 RepID=R7THR2_CAPTE|nr:hypothetical protein CAPTEDRAFT_211967 [Capitella teleta]|eukprot:ELT93264.1 hypothetical protein CAPTEDRAFT_211967 [Capitella teleta]